jgi:hypothetical protein
VAGVSGRHTSELLKGCTEPRIFTPPLRDLSRAANAGGPVTTLGWDVIDFAEKDLGIELHPYQAWLYVHALELLESGDFRFSIIIILIARQNGKTTWWKILILYVMYVLGMKLVLSTAQDLDTAEETWQAVVDLVTDTDDDDVPLLPDLAAQVKRVVQVNGKKSLDLKTGERYKAKAASRRAGRGLSGDVVGMDEAREQQNWDAWSAITHTTMARSRSLIVLLSNAGDASSLVLRYFRKLAHSLLGDPDGINADDDPASLLPDGDDEDDYDPDVDDNDIGLFEWSAPPNAAIRDRAGWAQANPSMNLPNGIPERKIRAATREPEWVFRTEVLCQWSEGTLEGLYPPGAWEGSADEDSARGTGQPVVLCVDVSWDRTRAHIGLATWRADGGVHVEVIASRAGTDWMIPWLNAEERSDVVREAPVVVQSGRTPAAPLIDPLEDAGRKVIEWSGSDLTSGFSLFYDLVRSAIGEGTGTQRVWHRNQTALNTAAATAVPKPAGDAWVIDRKKSPADASPLIAVNGAAWALLSGLAKPKRSKYEDSELVVV